MDRGNVWIRIGSNCHRRGSRVDFKCVVFHVFFVWVGNWKFRDLRLFVGLVLFSKTPKEPNNQVFLLKKNTRKTQSLPNFWQNPFGLDQAHGFRYAAATRFRMLVAWCVLGVGWGWLLKPKRENRSWPLETWSPWFFAGSFFGSKIAGYVFLPNKRRFSPRNRPPGPTFSDVPQEFCCWTTL